MEFIDQTGPSVRKHNQHQNMRSILIVLVYLISFTLLDLITKQFEVLPGIVPWYPTAGLTYALLLVCGVRFTPAVIVAIFFSSVFIYRMPQSSFQLLLWSCVVSLVYAAGAWFLSHRIHLDWQLQKFRDVAWLVGTAVLVSGFLAVLSVLSSALSSAIPRSEVLRAIFQWWVGETVGVLTVTPFLLVYVMPWLKRFADGKPEWVSILRLSPYSMLACIGQMASLLIVLYWIFGLHLQRDQHREFLILLPVIWIALTRGLKGTTAVILILNFGVVLVQWYFRFDLMRLGELELLMIVICILGLLMGAVVTERKDAEELLLESELKFRTIFDRNLDGILIADIETRRFLMGNSTICQMLGYTHDEMCGMSVDEIHPLEHLPYVLEQFFRQASGEITLADSLPVKRKDGSVFLADVSATSVTLSGHTYTMGIFHDITKSKRSEEEIITQLKELQRWQAATLGRENRILELKHEVNVLLSVAQQSPRYPSAESHAEQES